MEYDKTMRRLFFYCICGAFFVNVLIGVAWGQNQRRNQEEISPDEAQLELVESLLRVRLPAIEYSEKSSFNKALDKMEHLLAEKGLDIKFERQPADDDFNVPLSGVKFNYGGRVASGPVADVLQSFCHEAGCAYCVRNGKIYVYKAPTEKVKLTYTYPSVFINRYFDKNRMPGVDQVSRLKLRAAIAASRGKGRAEILYDDNRELLTLEDNLHNLYYVKQMLNDLYAEWRRLPEAKKYGAADIRNKRYSFERQLEARRAVPVEFSPDCTLSVLMRYLSLHTAAGRIKTPVRVRTTSDNAAGITMDSPLNFNYCTVLEVLEQICDACGGHYLVKGSNLTIVPRELEMRRFRVTYSALRIFMHGGLPSPATVRKKVSRKDITNDLIQSALQDVGIKLTGTSGVSYDSEKYNLEIHASQTTHRNLERLLHYLHAPKKK